MSTWTCSHCGHEYRTAEGDLEAWIVPGTSWDDLPDYWMCPECHAPKLTFTRTDLGEPGHPGWIVR
jgi:rubredoxin